MKLTKTLSLIAAVSIGIFSTSCTQYPSPNAKTGSVVGGLLGAGAGALIGDRKGRGLEGAAIGAAVGALGGGLLGGARDDRERQYNNQSRPPYYNDRYPPRDSGRYDRYEQRPSYNY